MSSSFTPPPPPPSHPPNTSYCYEITGPFQIDKKISYVKNNNTEMYAKTINFDYKKSLIELTDNVVIVRNGQKINGDYGTLDTSNNSYKIKSKNQNKVKVVIQSGE